MTVTVTDSRDSLAAQRRGVLQMKLGLIFALAMTGCADPAESGSYQGGGNEPGELGANPGGDPANPGGASSSGSTSSSSSSAGGPGNQPKAVCSKSTKSYGTMKAWQCVPSGAPKKAGLVVALHGYTQGVEQGGTGQPWGYKPTTQWETLAEKHKFYVLYPDKGTQAFSWYSFFGTSGIARSDLEPTNIAQMTKDFIAEHDIDPNKVFVNGLSAGGYMSVV